MSIEQKIAEILAESRAASAGQVSSVVSEQEQEVEDTIAEELVAEEQLSDGETKVEGDEENNKRNNVTTQEVGGKSKTANVVTKGASAPEAGGGKIDVKEDVAALVEGEELTEEFKQKAATIFEAAVMSRVKQEVAKLDEAYEAKLAEQVEQITEGLVEKVDGYLDYVVEQWMEQNEIALERGMKSEILEGFVSGLKSLFEDHYIDIPDEKFDVVGSLEEEVTDLKTKLDEQMATSVELKRALVGYQTQQIVAELSEGLTDTDTEKFHTLVEELEFDGVESFKKKAQTIRESYFTNKATAKTVVETIVTDSPVVITEEGSAHAVPASMKSYLSVLDNLR